MGGGGRWTFSNFVLNMINAIITVNKTYLLHNIDFGSGIKPFNKYKYFH